MLAPQPIVPAGLPPIYHQRFSDIPPRLYRSEGCNTLQQALARTRSVFSMGTSAYCEHPHHPALPLPPAARRPPPTAHPHLPNRRRCLQPGAEAEPHRCPPPGPPQPPGPPPAPESSPGQPRRRRVGVRRGGGQGGGRVSDRRLRQTGGGSGWALGKRTYQKEW